MACREQCHDVECMADYDHSCHDVLCQPSKVWFTRPDHTDTHTVKTTSDAHGEFLICMTCVLHRHLRVGRYSPEGGHEVLGDDHLGGVSVVGDGEGD